MTCNGTCNYTSIEPSCGYFNSLSDDWDVTSCSVSSYTPYNTTCICSGLSNLVSKSVVSIDYSTVLISIVS